MLPQAFDDPPFPTILLTVRLIDYPFGRFELSTSPQIIDFMVGFVWTRLRVGTVAFLRNLYLSVRERFTNSTPSCVLSFLKLALPFLQARAMPGPYVSFSPLFPMGTTLCGLAFRACTICSFSSFGFRDCHQLAQAPPLSPLYLPFARIITTDFPPSLHGHTI